VVKDRDTAVRWLAFYAKVKNNPDATADAFHGKQIPGPTTLLDFRAALVRYMADKGHWPADLTALQEEGYAEFIPPGVGNYDASTGTFSYAPPQRGG
jgi:hypothetical protein